MIERSREAMVVAALALAQSRANDVVLLALLPAEEAAARVGEMDLAMLDSFERTPTGGVKVKVLDRAAALRVAWDCLDAMGDPEAMADFWRAANEGGAG